MVPYYFFSEACHPQAVKKSPPPPLLVFSTGALKGCLPPRCRKCSSEYHLSAPPTVIKLAAGKRVAESCLSFLYFSIFLSIVLFNLSVLGLILTLLCKDMPSIQVVRVSTLHLLGELLLVNIFIKYFQNSICEASILQ